MHAHGCFGLTLGHKVFISPKYLKCLFYLLSLTCSSWSGLLMYNQIKKIISRALWYFVTLTLKDQFSKVALVVKNLSASAGDLRDVGSILGSGWIPGVGNGNPLQYSCLENSMDRGASGVASMWQRRVRNEWVTEHACTHTHMHAHTHTHTHFKRSGYNGRLLFDGQFETNLENRRNWAEHPCALCLPLCYTHLQVHTVILLFLLSMMRSPLPMS